MKTLTVLLFGIILLCPRPVAAQVDEIKQASASQSSFSGGSSNVQSGSSDDDNNAGVGVVLAEFLFQVYVGAVAEWQQYKIKKKEVNPTVISFDVMLQGAVQPSAYYLLQPRVRGNWGLFSTDFRVNYLVEETIEGTKSLRTDDWQILQLNLITTKNVVARIGGGILHEDYSGGKTFAEWTAGLHVQSNTQHLGGMVEYRWSEPRDEWSAQIQYRVFQTGSLNGYVTLGGVHQQYYSHINVWGVQGGFMFRIF
jgi:hypothetical protein